MARYTQLQEIDVLHIATDYDLHLTHFEFIDGGAGNSSYLLHTDQGEYVLTVFEEKTLAEVINIGQLLLQLAANGFSTTRLLLPSKGDMAPLIREKPLMIKAYISGQVYPDLDEGMLFQLGAAMARLHKIPAPDYLPITHSYGRQVFPTLFDQGIDPLYESWLAGRTAYLNQRIPPGLPTGLIHGDLFFDNILFEDRDLKAIIDFEEACHYYKVFDIGMGIVGLCAAEDKIDLEKARFLVTGYQQVREMEKIEKQSLQLFVEYAATAVSYWRFWKYNIDSPTPKKADKHWQMARLAQTTNEVPQTRFFQEVFENGPK